MSPDSRGELVGENMGRYSRDPLSNDARNTGAGPARNSAHADHPAQRATVHLGSATNPQMNV
jgi:hypothetical protein